MAAVLCAGGCRGADAWIELKTPHFTVISEASEGRTRDWAVEFELFRRAMMMVMPVDGSAVEPVTIVLFRSDRRLRPFKPMENGKPAAVAGYFARAPGRNFIAASIEGARDDVREVVYHEAVHWHLAASERPRPLWLEEGLAQVFANFRLSGNSFVIGGFRPESMRHVKVAKALPFAKMMEVGSLAYNGQHGDLTALFYHQSWLMTHELFFGAKGVGVPALGVFLGRPAVERNTTRDFECGLGVSAVTMDQRLADYMNAGRFRTFTMPLDRNATEVGFVLRNAPAGEVDLTCGNLLIGAGRPAEAEDYLSRAAAALPGDPRVLESLGGMDLALGRMDAAMVKFQDGLRAGARSYVAHFLLGQRALNAAYGLRFGEPDTTEAVGHFVNAVRLNSRFVPAYEALALAASFLPKRSPEVEQLLDAAGARYLANTKLQAGLALLASKHGDRRKANPAVEQAQTALGDDPSNAGSANLVSRMVAPTLANSGAAANAPVPESGIVQAVSVAAQLEQTREFLTGKHWEKAEQAIAELLANPLAASRRSEILTLQRELDAARPQ